MHRVVRFIQVLYNLSGLYHLKAEDRVRAFNSTGADAPP